MKKGKFLLTISLHLQDLVHTFSRKYANKIPRNEHKISKFLFQIQILAYNSQNVSTGCHSVLLKLYQSIKELSESYELRGREKEKKNVTPNRANANAATFFTANKSNDFSFQKQQLHV